MLNMLSNCRNNRAIQPALSANCLQTGSSLTLDTSVKNSDQKRLSLSLRNIFGKKSSMDLHSVKKNSTCSMNKENSFSSTNSNSKNESKQKSNTDTFRSIVRTSMLINRVIENFKIGRETAVVKNEQKAVKVWSSWAVWQDWAIYWTLGNF